MKTAGNLVRTSLLVIWSAWVIRGAGVGAAAGAGAGAATDAVVACALAELGGAVGTGPAAGAVGGVVAGAGVVEGADVGADVGAGGANRWAGNRKFAGGGADSPGGAGIGGKPDSGTLAVVMAASGVPDKVAAFNIGVCAGAGAGALGSGSKLAGAPSSSGGSSVAGWFSPALLILLIRGVGLIPVLFLRGRGSSNWQPSKLPIPNKSGKSADDFNMRCLMGT